MDKLHIKKFKLDFKNDSVTVEFDSLINEEIKILNDKFPDVTINKKKIKYTLESNTLILFFPINVKSTINEYYNDIDHS
jgi:hypothetical protein